MTTIAVDVFGRVAWDSQMTHINERLFPVHQKVWVEDGCILGAAGDVGAAQMLGSWFRNGARFQRKPDGDWDLLVVRPDRTLWIYDSSFNTAVEIISPYAIGSGGCYAKAAMAAGARADVAVKIACTFDIYSGLPVHTLDFNDVFKGSQ